MAAKTPETAIVAVDASNYPAIDMDSSDLKAAIDANLGGETLGYKDIRRVKVPTGGGLAWSIPDLDGGRPKTADDFTGVIIYTTLNRVLWRSKFGEGEKGPPECFGQPDDHGIWYGSQSRKWIATAASEKGLEAAPTSATDNQDCGSCPFAKFGSGSIIGKPKAPACQKKRPTYIATEDSVLPMALNIPAGSLDNAKQFLIGLSSKKPVKNYTDVVARFSLDKATAGTTDYAKVVIQRVADLPEDQKIALRQFAAAIRPMLQQVTQAALTQGEQAIFDADDDGPTPED